MPNRILPLRDFHCETLFDLLDATESFHPEGTAFIENGKRILRGELGRQSRNLAFRLTAMGLKKGDRVAVVLKKSIDAVVSIAAVLRAGGIYVPVDRFQPVSRIAYIVEDCGCAILISDEAFFSQYPRKEFFPGVGGDVDVATWQEEPSGGAASTAGDPSADPDETAFILYTSGSTGRPKGVTITHRNIVQFIRWSVDALRLGPDDVFSWHANLNFDLSTFDVYASMAAGGTAVLFSEEEMRNPWRLGEMVEEYGITIWYSVPAVLQLMTVSGVFKRLDCRSLRVVLFAGEVFPVSGLRKLMEDLPHAAFYNLYGPTETNVCTFHRVRLEECCDGRPLSIGRPLPGVRAWICDDRGTALPEGEMGELMIEGPCVAAGYWNLTGHRNEENHRKGIHATGDLVVCENNLYYYRGRIDNMIKLNGFRIELGEIERVLEMMDAVLQAAIIPIAGEARIRLVACCSVGRSQAEDPSLLSMKRHCADHLPAYMIPHQLRVFEDLPQNPNGKVDRVHLKNCVCAGSEHPETCQER